MSPTLCLKNEGSAALLEETTVSTESLDTLKLASLPKGTLASILHNRGVRLDSMRETISVIEELGQFMNAEQFVDSLFHPRIGKATPFPVSRFSDGTFPVYYSALEEETCKREMQHYFREDIKHQRDPPKVQSRTYNLIHCHFQGKVADLLRMQEQHPELTSETREGYPHCQEIATEAIDRGIQGLLAPSARNRGGSCVPIFDRNALSAPEIGKVLKLHVGPVGA